MRVLGFSKMWPKLNEPELTTFRLPRKDRDWALGETVQIVYHPRSKDRKILSAAQIIAKEPKFLLQITNVEAVLDGFSSLDEMRAWFYKTHGDSLGSCRINKLTIRRLRNES